MRSSSIATVVRTGRGVALIAPATAFIALASLCVASPVLAGAWTRDPGSVFLKVGYEHWYTSARFDSSGDRVSYLPPTGATPVKSQYRSEALRAYAEYGVTADLTLGAAAAYVRIEAEGQDRFDRSSGLSDLTIAIKRRLLRAPLVVSIAGESKLPTGYAATRFPSLGSGKPDFGVRIEVGASRARAYATADAGYRIRGGAQADELPLGIEAGVSVLSDLTLRGNLRASMTGGHASGGARFDPALADSRYVAAGTGLVLHGKPFDAVIDVDRVLSGRNTLAGVRLGFSLWYSN